ncbi:MAG: hypothetical protein AB8D52_03330 [Gammaproteobacteria bacterium]
MLISLIAIVNPLGAIPVFLTLTLHLRRLLSESASLRRQQFLFVLSCWYHFLKRFSNCILTQITTIKNDIFKLYFLTDN